MEKRLNVETYFGDINVKISDKLTVENVIQNILGELFISQRYHCQFALFVQQDIILQNNDRVGHLTDQKLDLVLLRYPQIEELDEIPPNLLKYSYIQMNKMLYNKIYNISIPDLFYLSHINQYVNNDLRVDVVSQDLKQIYKVQCIHWSTSDRQTLKAIKAAQENDVLKLYMIQCKRHLKLYDYLVLQCNLIKREGMYYTDASVGINNEKIIIVENDEVFFTDYLYNIQFKTDSRGIYIWNEMSQAFLMFKQTINFQDYILFFKRSQCTVELGTQQLI